MTPRFLSKTKDVAFFISGAYEANGLNSSVDVFSSVGHGTSYGLPEDIDSPLVNGFDVRGSP